MSAGRFAGRLAVVTGGSRGIGAETGKILAGDGARVISLSRTAPPAGSGIEHVPCDITDSAAVASAAARVLQAFGRAPDIIINNAGIFRVAPLADVDVEAFSATLGANLFGPFLVLRAFLAGMIARGSGHVITIGSIADRNVFAGNGAYAASKHGLRAMHEVLRAELKGSGVRNTLISPSSVDTSLWDPVLAGAADDPAAGFPQRSGMLRPEDVVGAIVYALSQPERVTIEELRLSHS